MSDTVKMKHHAIAIPDLTPADRILEAARHLNTALRQHPKKAPSKEIEAIELLQEVLLGEKKKPLPMNSVQQNKVRQRKTEARTNEAQPVQVSPSIVQITPEENATPTEKPNTNYVSDNEEEDEILPPISNNHDSDDDDDDSVANSAGVLEFVHLFLNEIWYTRV